MTRRKWEPTHELVMEGGVVDDELFMLAECDGELRFYSEHAWSPGALLYPPSGMTEAEAEVFGFRFRKLGASKEP
jgi:hypothetical protein